MTLVSSTFGLRLAIVALHTCLLPMRVKYSRPFFSNLDPSLALVTVARVIALSHEAPWL
jgi:hypothetical protein